jgi:polar amino acid transport system substrate-binding protein
LETGKLDAAIRASKTVEREKFAYFTTPYRDEVMAVYARKQSGITRFEDLQAAYLKGLILIGPANGFYGDAFEHLKTRWLAANRYTQYKQSHKAHQLLFATPTRGDIIFVDSDIFYHSLGKQLSQEVESPTDWIRVSPIHIIMSKASVSQATVERLNKAILTLTKDGTLARIVDKYRPAYVQQQVEKHRQRAEQ